MIFVLLVVALVGLSKSSFQETTTTTDNTDNAAEEKFLYFAYGSNLLASRIHINNPSAVRISSAKLMNHRLDFGHWSERWKGAAATVAPEQGDHVWGCVWELDMKDMENLDGQEGVASGVYFPFQVEVENPGGEKLWCRCYQLCDTPDKLEPGEPIPDDRLPSELYLNVIIMGARETGLPDYYVEQLEKLPHNDYKGDNSTDLTYLVSG